MVKRVNKLNPVLINPEYARFDALPDGEREAVFVATADELGATVQAVEKDFHVCRVIDALFRAAPTQPKLFFKGGTSLSKGFGIIRRFSEDIDLVLSRRGLGVDVTADPMITHFSNRGRDAAVSSIMRACSEHVIGPMQSQLRELLPQTYSITIDPTDPDNATLLVAYPSLFPAYDYLRPHVKVECGARGEAEPSQQRPIAPYLQGELATRGWNFTTVGVTLIKPERTCWEKLSILHVAHCRASAGDRAAGDRQFSSRHYYDVAELMDAGVVTSALATPSLLDDVKKNQHLMWRTNQGHLQTATPGTFRISPPLSAIPALRQDYAGMAGMMFGQAPSFDEVMDRLSKVEALLNGISVIAELRPVQVNRPVRKAKASRR